VAIALLATGLLSAIAQSGKNEARKPADSTASATAVWAGVTVSNLDVSRKWYEERLGFRLSKNMDLPEHKLRIAFLELNGFTLELIEFQESVSLATITNRIPELKDRDHL
jgi:hypothetical protein